MEKYITEVRLPEDSRLVGKRLPQINAFVENGVNILGLVRGGGPDTRRFDVRGVFELNRITDLPVLTRVP